MNIKELQNEIMVQLRPLTLTIGRPVTARVNEIPNRKQGFIYEVEFFIGLNLVYTYQLDRFSFDGAFSEGDAYEAISELKVEKEAKFAEILVENHGFAPRPIFLEEDNLKSLSMLHHILLAYYTYKGKGDVFKVTFQDATREKIENFCAIQAGFYYKRPTYNSVELNIAQVELLTSWWSTHNIDVLTYLNRLFYSDVNPDPYPEFPVPITTLVKDVKYVNKLTEHTLLAYENIEKLKKAASW